MNTLKIIVDKLVPNERRRIAASSSRERLFKLSHSRNFHFKWVQLWDPRCSVVYFVKVMFAVEWKVTYGIFCRKERAVHHVRSRKQCGWASKDEKTVTGVLESKSLFLEKNLFLCLIVFHGKAVTFIAIEERSRVPVLYLIMRDVVIFYWRPSVEAASSTANIAFLRWINIVTTVYVSTVTISFCFK